MTITELKTDLAEKIRAETGENVYLCYQCVKCGSGCPLGEFADLTPNQVLRAAQLGLDEMALSARMPWLCAGCQTCTTRCPNGIDVARVMDFMVAEARARGIPPKVPEVALFNKVFLRNVNLLGRAYELGLVAEMNLRTLQPTKDLGMGMDMIRRSKIRLLPEFVRPPRRPKPVKPAANQMAYYPGCSLHSMASEYDHSIRAVSKTLGLELVEPEGWVCCGSSPAHRVDHKLATKLPLQNLALIEQMGLDEVTLPCAACFNRFKAAQHELEHHPELKDSLQQEIGYALQRSVAVRSLIDVMVNKVGLPAITAKTARPLAGLKVACYYGCLLTRPPAITGADSPEYPMEMDRLITSLGATVVDWGSKTSCCGASLSATRTEIALKLSGNILEDARAAGADVVVVACPLCHTNLDGRQHQIIQSRPGAGPEMPVLYFTQLMALAFGLGEKAAALSKNMVNPRPVLRAKGVLS